MIATLSENITTATASIASGSIASTTNNVASIPALPPGEEIYDIMDTLSLDYPWFTIIKEALFIIVFILLIYYFYKWLISPVIRKRYKIVQSPEIQAMRAIKRLKLSDIWKNKDIKSICENVAAILKNYTQDAYNIGIGAAATTDEFIPDLIDGRVKNSILSKIKDILEYCDNIRYTGSFDNIMEPEELVGLLENIINTEGWKQ